jgi:uncharacterized protein
MIPLVPQFPSFRDISITDKKLLADFFSDNPPSTSELTFTNFYIWRHCDRSKISNMNGNLCIYAMPENEPPYFFEPIGTNNIEDTIKKCLSRIPRMSRLSSSFVDKYFAGKSGYKIEEDRDNSDYLYLKDDLADLSGKRFDGKRNRIKKFLKSNKDVEYRPLDDSTVAGCLGLLGRWKAEKRKDNCFDGPIKEALENFEALSLSGAVILVKNEVKAFTVGEKLNKETAVVYIEVVDPLMEGLSQFINNEFVKRQWSGCVYINRESDLGNAGLRRAKSSYHPVQIVPKYTVMI